VARLHGDLTSYTAIGDPSYVGVLRTLRPAALRLIAAHGRIDILVNNAGVFLASALTETSLEDFKRVMDIDVTGVFLGMRTVAPTMIERELAGDDSVYVTGSEMVVDGGTTA
jgi:NAD(P)-dependent dehydrogenase (short-subunit alcohol dehydrogenase family)